MSPAAKQKRLGLPVHSNLHACTHKEHQILMSTEATAFAAQFLDWNVYPFMFMQ
jgi:hypothetical protein